jgi:hypothetical protein
MKRIQCAPALAGLFIVAVSASGQLFTAETRTVASDQGSNDTSPGATRFFSDAAFSIAAPVGTAIWFVADTARNGITMGNPTLSTLFSGDNVVLFRDVLVGDSPGATPGRYRRLSIDVPAPGQGSPANLYRQADIWVVVWNGSGPGFQPAIGSTFGIYNTGSFTVPEFGNAWWAIDGNIHTGQFTVVPEPGAFVALGAAGLGGWAAWRRRRRAMTAR